MTTNLPAPREEGPLVIDTMHDLHPDHQDPQHQEVRQRLSVALLPMALIALALLSFVAAAWTFVAAS
jgi:hypothetical protein